MGRILLFTLNTEVNVFQVKEGGRVRGQNNGESKYKEFCKNSVVSGGRERNWKTEDKWVSGRVLIIVGNIEHVYKC